MKLKEHTIIKKIDLDHLIYKITKQNDLENENINLPDNTNQNDTKDWKEIIIPSNNKINESYKFKRKNT